MAFLVSSSMTIEVVLYFTRLSPFLCIPQNYAVFIRMSIILFKRNIDMHVIII